MLPGVSGRLISATFAQTQLLTLPGAAPPPTDAARALDRLLVRREAAIGPASSIRSICDVVVVPLLRILGFDTGRRADEPGRTLIDAVGPGAATVPVLVLPYGTALDRAWRAAIIDGIRTDARWCFCCNGATLRIVDARQAWSRQYLEFELALLSMDETRTVFWSLARAATLCGRPPLLDRAAALSTRHGITVCRALGAGVLDALALLFGALSQRLRASQTNTALFDQSLTILYRVLFLLFAEARGLVPIWHPVYRDRYSIEAIVAALVSGRRYRGIWAAVIAISRLAHAGCNAGELKVTAFNGRLFAPACSSAFETATVADDVMGPAVLALTTASVAGQRPRIAYRDLDVEQLGAIYERVLEYEPAPGTPPVLRRTGDARKSSGTFYTPRALTAHLVRRTLAPLVEGRSAEAILRLRVLDPAMGSGAFLVAACRFLAAAVEEALVREGTWHPGDVTAADRAAVRREVAQRCLFGVDVNPMAVQLARLSIWLATLASDRPLTFLDHHLVVGDSLLGATPEDVRRQPTRGAGPTRRAEALPLFDHVEPSSVLEHAALTRLRLTNEPDANASVVRAKEKTLAALRAEDSPLSRWTRVLDLWCAGWFWEDGPPPGAAVFVELSSLVLRGSSSLPARTVARFLDHSALLAGRYRFLHWPLVFPEVFRDERGEGFAGAGFDAVVGNPPWDMIRGDSGQDRTRSARRDQARRVVAFARESGVYRVDTRSHVNRYQLFVERALQLVRPEGRIGLVLPSGLAMDAGAGPLRRHLFDAANVEAITGLDNQGAIFPIHRSVRFLLLTATAGQPTRQIACRFGVSRTDDLERQDEGRTPLVLTRRFLARISGEDDLGVPALDTETDLRIVEQINARHPWLGVKQGWGVEFGRELNASDDREWLAPYRGGASACPVVEGKHVGPFRVSWRECRYELRADRSRASAPRRPRLAYRDVASATNRLTLIAAVVPARVVTTHTLFCLKTPLAAAAQHALCALLNSFVANYLIRFRVNTHVTVSLVSRMPVPILAPGDSALERLAALSRALSIARAPIDAMPEYVELQACVARLYGVSRDELRHVLGRFPLIDRDVRSRILARFDDLR